MQREAVKKPPVAGRRRGNGESTRSGHSHGYSITGTVTRQESQTPIYVAGRIVGHVSGGIFVKSVRGSVHQLRRPPAWAVDVGSLDDAEQLGARTVEIHDRDNGAVYRASIATIRARGWTFDRGWGRQIALPLSEWRVTRPDEVVQLSLFVGVTP